MANITLEAHRSSGYRSRTMVNARRADLTVAFAVDYTTAGERLTASVAGDLYAAIPLGTDPLSAARMLYRAMRSCNARILNIAGNGLHTLSRHGWQQDQANEWVYRVLATVLPHWPLKRIRSGGQTGVDMAGLIAGHALGVDVLGHFPKGFRQRGADGKDFTASIEDLRVLIQDSAQQLHDIDISSAYQ